VVLTDREWASVIIVAGAALLIVAIPRLRRFVRGLFADVLKAAFVRKIVVIYSGLLFWSALAVYVGWLLGLWNVGLLKDTSTIVFTLGFPILFRSVSSKSGIEILKHVVRETVGVTALLIFYLNLQSFPLGWEIAFQIVLLVLVVLNAMAALALSTVPSFEDSSGKSCVLVLARAAQVIFSLLMSLVALGAFTWTTVQLVISAGTIQWLDLVQSFLLTLWLPALLIPYFYVVAFYAYAELLLVRVTFRKATPWRARLGFVLGLRFSVSLAARFDGRYNAVSESRTFRDALTFMRSFRSDLRKRDTEEQARLTSLKEFAGVEGTDYTGAQLDRREFDATKGQLNYIAMTQMGRYAGNGNRYWDDLTDVLVDSRRFPLPADHGIHVEITADDQQWRCWRELPSGWHLGVGGAAGKDEVFYQGAVPPTTWPLDVPTEWGGYLDDSVPPDWEHDDSSPVAR